MGILKAVASIRGDVPTVGRARDRCWKLALCAAQHFMPIAIVVTSVLVQHTVKLCPPHFLDWHLVNIVRNGKEVPLPP